MADALANLRILDFSRVLAGPFTTMMLADLGAEVIKVERPGPGDETRAWGPPWDGAGEATYYQAVNRNKRGVILDLASSTGLARARSLAAVTTVVWSTSDMPAAAAARTCCRTRTTSSPPLIGSSSITHDR